MLITILTLFPEQFTGVFGHSIIKRAQEKNLVTIKIINIRDFATDKHKSVDDRPYGGGVGMILKVDVLDRAINFARTTNRKIANPKVVLLDPQGTTYSQTKAKELARSQHLILACGHYEGVDERVRALVDEQISIGDYVLTGGEIPAMAVVDSVVRLVPGVLTKAGVTDEESFSQPKPLLEHPQYTRPADYKHHKVPPVLLSGSHKTISDWRKSQSIDKTQQQRPDLLKATRRVQS